MSKAIEIKLLRRENKRLRKRLAKMSNKPTLTQNTWVSVIDIMIAFLNKARSVNPKEIKGY